MTTKTNEAPRSAFRPIFPATITPASIERKQTAKGTDYLLMQNATVERDGKDAQTRTAMAFGKSVTDVESMLESGTPVELAVQFDGGTVRIVGPVREKQAAES